MPVHKRLHTFVAPRPRPGLIRALIPVNRWLNLYGIPGLRDWPILRHWPLVRGLCDIRRFDIPAADDARLRHSLNVGAAVFLTPNHPEFFTDWMIDKEIAARYAPLTANWATHDIVNGMGHWGQRFWLANHLIAQVPGDTEAALAYSLATAQGGTPVLLHPEGQVRWQSDHIGPLFEGAAKMALRAAAAGAQPVLIQPIIWKLKFVCDEEAALHAEMALVERQLQLERGDKLSLPLRLARLYRQVLWQRFQNMGFAPPRHLGFFEAQERLLQQLLTALASFGRFSGSLEQQAEQMLAALRRAEKDGQTLDRMTRRWRRELGFILRNPQQVYRQPRWQQEHIAECLKRLRCDHLCHGGWRQRMHKLLPRPVGGRIAHVRAPEPVDVRALLATRPDLDAAALTRQLRQSMQSTLDALNAELNAAAQARDYANPLLRQAGEEAGVSSTDW